jgi:radical SAM protein with 4Fe4S-binding SPASM domain
MGHFTQELNYLIRVGGIGKFYDNWKKCQGIAPFQVPFMITSQCNLRCIMCSIWKTPPEKFRDELSTLEVENLIKQLSELGTYSITITGGEPLLRKDILDIIMAIKRRKMRVSIVTNGTLITESLAVSLVKCGLENITLSIDSPFPEIHDKLRGVKGTWEKAVQGMKFINHARKECGTSKPSVIIDYIIANLNYKDIGKFIDLQPKLGYDAIRFIPYTGVDRLSLTDPEKEELRKTLPIIKTKLHSYNLSYQSLPRLMLLCGPKEYTQAQIMCFIPWIYAVISPWGDVYPCCLTATAPHYLEAAHGLIARGPDKFVMGNVRSKKFREIWNGKEFVDFRKQCKSSINFYRCSSCNYTPLNLFLTKLFRERPFLFKFIWRKILNLRYTYQDMLVDYLKDSNTKKDMY